RGAPEIDAEAVILAAYLHDIGRSPLLAGDPRDHNILSGLVLAAEGLDACVEPARRHAVYTVLDPVLAPRTAAEKLVYVADRRGRDLVGAWLSKRGAHVRRDAAANLFARFGGEGKVILVGSHLDSVPEGGRFDGALGVLCAIEAVESLVDAHVRLRPVEVVA